MSEFEINDGILHRECEALAKEIFEEFQAEGGEDFDPEAVRDEMSDRAHETADGHEWVIYNHKALMLCAHCDTGYGEDMLSDIGMPDDPDIYKIACITAYGEMRGRIEAELTDMIEAWEETKAECEA